MTPHPALFIESIANCKPCGAKARTFCRSSSAMKVVTAVNSCQFTCRTKRKGVPGRGHPFIISDFLREILLCVCRLRRLGRGVSALISLLSCKPHGVEDRRKRLIVTVVRGLRSDADEIEQTLRTQHSDDPIRFLAPGRRNVAEICRKARLAVQAQTLALPRDFHARV